MPAPILRCHVVMGAVRLLATSQPDTTPGWATPGLGVLLVYLPYSAEWDHNKCFHDVKLKLSCVQHAAGIWCCYCRAQLKWQTREISLSWQVTGILMIVCNMLLVLNKWVRVQTCFWVRDWTAPFADMFLPEHGTQQWLQHLPVAPVYHILWSSVCGSWE